MQVNDVIVTQDIDNYGQAYISDGNGECQFMSTRIPTPNTIHLDVSGLTKFYIFILIEDNYLQK